MRRSPDPCFPDDRQNVVAKAARLPGWESAFVAEMEAVDALPFGYGRDQIDCLRRVARIAMAVTGVDPMQGHRNYASETGAFKQLSKAGFRSIEDALRSVFCEIPHARAMRGDCGVLEQLVDGVPQLTAFVVIQNHMASAKGPGGNSYVSVDQLKSVFAVGVR